jgi:hypothetical protein
MPTGGGINHTATRSYKTQSSQTMSLAETINGDIEINSTLTIPANTTNQAIVIVLTQANLQSVCLYANGAALTVKTNSSGSPQDTIALVIGQCLVWTLQTDGIGKCPFSASITEFFVTNASGNAATFQYACVVNQ